ncbi:rCG27948 [Rattus norvegicus]|uniref:RCG27948 n=1 Tax=Rattus norvegicus TaxID=10116 RepID=A6IDW4_RAT|nr:rCG27948 [Rattus norvegicus]
MQGLAAGSSPRPPAKGAGKSWLPRELGEESPFRLCYLRISWSHPLP